MADVNKLLPDAGKIDLSSTAYTEKDSLQDITNKYTDLGNTINSLGNAAAEDVHQRQVKLIGNDFGPVNPMMYGAYYQPSINDAESTMRVKGTQKALEEGMERGKKAAEANLAAAKSTYKKSIDAYNNAKEAFANAQVAILPKVDTGTRENVTGSNTQAFQDFINDPAKAKNKAVTNYTDQVAASRDPENFWNNKDAWDIAKNNVRKDTGKDISDEEFRSNYDYGQAVTRAYIEEYFSSRGETKNLEKFRSSYKYMKKAVNDVADYIAGVIENPEFLVNKQLIREGKKIEGYDNQFIADFWNGTDFNNIFGFSVMDMHELVRWKEENPQQFKEYNEQLAQATGVSQTTEIADGERWYLMPDGQYKQLQKGTPVFFAYPGSMKADGTYNDKDLEKFIKMYRDYYKTDISKISEKELTNRQEALNDAYKEYMKHVAGIIRYEQAFDRTAGADEYNTILACFDNVAKSQYMIYGHTAEEWVNSFKEGIKKSPRTAAAYFQELAAVAYEHNPDIFRYNPQLGQVVTESMFYDKDSVAPNENKLASRAFEDQAVREAVRKLPPERATAEFLLYSRSMELYNDGATNDNINPVFLDNKLRDFSNQVFKDLYSNFVSVPASLVNFTVGTVGGFLTTGQSQGLETDIFNNNMSMKDVWGGLIDPSYGTEGHPNSPLGKAMIQGDIDSNAKKYAMSLVNPLFVDVITGDKEWNELTGIAQQYSNESPDFFSKTNIDYMAMRMATLFMSGYAQAKVLKGVSAAKNALMTSKMADRVRLAAMPHIVNWTSNPTIASKLSVIPEEVVGVENGQSAIRGASLSVYADDALRVTQAEAKRAATQATNATAELTALNATNKVDDLVAGVKAAGGRAAKSADNLDDVYGVLTRNAVHGLTSMTADNIDDLIKNYGSLIEKSKQTNAAYKAAAEAVPKVTLKSGEVVSLADATLVTQANRVLGVSTLNMMTGIPSVELARLPDEYRNLLTKVANRMTATSDATNYSGSLNNFLKSLTPDDFKAFAQETIKRASINADLGRGFEKLDLYRIAAAVGWEKSGVKALAREFLKDALTDPFRDLYMNVRNPEFTMEGKYHVQTIQEYFTDPWNLAFNLTFSTGHFALSRLKNQAGATLYSNWADQARAELNATGERTAEEAKKSFQRAFDLQNKAQQFADNAWKAGMNYNKAQELVAKSNAMVHTSVEQIFKANGIDVRYGGDNLHLDTKEAFVDYINNKKLAPQEGLYILANGLNLTATNNYFMNKMAIGTGVGEFGNLDQNTYLKVYRTAVNSASKYNEVVRSTDKDAIKKINKVYDHMKADILKANNKGEYGLKIRNLEKSLDYIFENLKSAAKSGLEDGTLKNVRLGYLPIGSLTYAGSYDDMVNSHTIAPSRGLAYEGGVINTAALNPSEARDVLQFEDIISAMEKGEKTIEVNGETRQLDYDGLNPLDMLSVYQNNYNVHKYLDPLVGDSRLKFGDAALKNYNAYIVASADAISKSRNIDIKHARDKITGYDFKDEKGEKHHVDGWADKIENAASERGDDISKDMKTLKKGKAIDTAMSKKIRDKAVEISKQVNDLNKKVINAQSVIKNGGIPDSGYAVVGKLFGYTINGKGNPKEGRKIFENGRNIASKLMEAYSKGTINENNYRDGFSIDIQFNGSIYKKNLTIDSDTFKAIENAYKLGAPDADISIRAAIMSDLATPIDPKTKKPVKDYTSRLRSLEKPRNDSHKSASYTYEVSSAGDKRFSAMHAKLAEGTTIEIDGKSYNVGGMTIEDAYQKVLKKSGKGLPPAKDSPLYVDNTLQRGSQGLTGGNIKPSKSGRMDFSYGNGAGDGITEKTTFEAIKSGKRTSTTRLASQHADYWKDLKVGDIVEFKNKGNTDAVLVKVTKAPEWIDPSKMSADDYNALLSKEGWSKEAFDKIITDKVKAGDKALQFEYELLKNQPGNSPSEPTVKTYQGLAKNDGNTIFVFGSNPEGRHGAGAAKTAKDQFGAIYGQGEGLQGNSYALPTKDLRVKENNSLRSISPEQITKNISKMYDVAREHPDKQFKVASYASDKNLNGYTAEEMAKMFLNAGDIPENVFFSEPMAKIMGDVKSDVSSYTRNQELPLKKVISGAQTGADTVGLEIANKLGYETGGTAAPKYYREKGFDKHDETSLAKLGVSEIAPELQVNATKKKDFYLPRTEQNVLNSDGTVYFNDAGDTPGFVATKRFAVKHQKPMLVNPTADELRQWIIDNNIETLNIAGNRGSKFAPIEKMMRESLVNGLSNEGGYKFLDVEDVSYQKGYLPLWRAWAKQNPELLKELAVKSTGLQLNDKFAKTGVNQARALTQILEEAGLRERPNTEKGIVRTVGKNGEQITTSVKDANSIISNTLLPNVSSPEARQHFVDVMNTRYKSDQNGVIKSQESKYQEMQALAEDFTYKGLGTTSEDTNDVKRRIVESLVDRARTELGTELDGFDGHDMLWKLDEIAPDKDIIDVLVNRTAVNKQNMFAVIKGIDEDGAIELFIDRLAKLKYEVAAGKYNDILPEGMSPEDFCNKVNDAYEIMAWATEFDAKPTRMESEPVKFGDDGEELDIDEAGEFGTRDITGNVEIESMTGKFSNVEMNLNKDDMLRRANSLSDILEIYIDEKNPLHDIVRTEELKKLHSGRIDASSSTKALYKEVVARGKELYDSGKSPEYIEAVDSATNSIVNRITDAGYKPNQDQLDAAYAEALGITSPETRLNQVASNGKTSRNYNAAKLAEATNSVDTSASGGWNEKVNKMRLDAGTYGGYANQIVNGIQALIDFAGSDKKYAKLLEQATDVYLGMDSVLNAKRSDATDNFENSLVAMLGKVYDPKNMVKELNGSEMIEAGTRIKRSITSTIETGLYGEPISGKDVKFEGFSQLRPDKTLGNGNVSRTDSIIHNAQDFKTYVDLANALYAKNNAPSDMYEAYASAYLTDVRRAYDNYVAKFEEANSVKDNNLVRIDEQIREKIANIESGQKAKSEKVSDLNAKRQQLLDEIEKIKNDSSNTNSQHEIDILNARIKGLDVELKDANKPVGISSDIIRLFEKRKDYLEAKTGKNITVLGDEASSKVAKLNELKRQRAELVKTKESFDSQTEDASFEKAKPTDAQKESNRQAIAELNNDISKLEREIKDSQIPKTVDDAKKLLESIDKHEGEIKSLERKPMQFSTFKTNLEESFNDFREVIHDYYDMVREFDDTRQSIPTPSQQTGKASLYDEKVLNYIGGQDLKARRINADLDIEIDGKKFRLEADYGTGNEYSETGLGYTLYGEDGFQYNIADEFERAKDKDATAKTINKKLEEEGAKVRIVNNQDLYLFGTEKDLEELAKKNGISIEEARKLNRKTSESIQRKFNGGKTNEEVLADLEQREAELVKAMSEARKIGDLKENEEYQSARKELAQVRDEIAERRGGVVIERNPRYGDTVQTLNGEWSIVNLLDTDSEGFDAETRDLMDTAWNGGYERSQQDIIVDALFNYAKATENSSPAKDINNANKVLEKAKKEKDSLRTKLHALKEKADAGVVTMDTYAKKYLDESDYAQYRADADAYNEIKTTKTDKNDYYRSRVGEYTIMSDGQIPKGHVSVASLLSSVGYDNGKFNTDISEGRQYTEDELKADRKTHKKMQKEVNDNLRKGNMVYKNVEDFKLPTDLDYRSRAMTINNLLSFMAQAQKKSGMKNLKPENVIVSKEYADLLFRVSREGINGDNMMSKLKTTAFRISDWNKFVQDLQLAGGVSYVNALTIAQIRGAIFSSPTRAAEYIKLATDFKDDAAVAKFVVENSERLVQIAMKTGDTTILTGFQASASSRPGYSDGGTLSAFMARVIDHNKHKSAAERTAEEKYDFTRDYINNAKDALFGDATFKRTLPVLRAKMMIMNYDQAYKMLQKKFTNITADELEDAACKFAYAKTTAFFEPNKTQSGFFRSKGINEMLDKVQTQTQRDLLASWIGAKDDISIGQMAGNCFFALGYKNRMIQSILQGVRSIVSPVELIQRRNVRGTFDDAAGTIKLGMNNTLDDLGTQFMQSGNRQQIKSIAFLAVTSFISAKALGLATAWDDLNFEDEMQTDENGNPQFKIPDILTKFQTIGQIWIPNAIDQEGHPYIDPKKKAFKIDTLSSIFTLPNIAWKTIDRITDPEAYYSAPQRGLPFLGVNNPINQFINADIPRAIGDELIGSNLLSPYKAMYEVLVDSSYYGNNIWEKKYLKDGSVNKNYDPLRNIRASIYHVLGFDALLSPRGYNDYVKGYYDNPNYKSQDQLGTVTGSGIFQHEYTSALFAFMNNDMWGGLVEAGELPIKSQKLSSTARTELNTKVKNAIAQYMSDYKDTIANTTDLDAKDRAYNNAVKRSADTLQAWSKKHGYVLGKDQSLLPYATRMLMAMLAGEYDDNLDYVQNTYWKASAIAQIEATGPEGYWLDDNDIDAWVASGKTPEEFAEEKNKRSNAYNQALDDEYRARKALHDAGIDSEYLAGLSLANIRAEQRQINREVYNGALQKMKSPIGEFKNFSEMKKYYEAQIDAAGSTKQKAKLAEQYNTYVTDALAPYIKKYGEGIIADGYYNNEYLANALAEYIIIPADKYYSGKTPRASYLKDLFHVGYRDGTKLPSDKEVIAGYEQARREMQKGYSASSASILNNLIEAIKKGRLYVSDRDYSKIVKMKAYLSSKSN